MYFRTLKKYKNEDQDFYALAAEFYGTIKLKKEMRREKEVFFNDLEIFA
jgi:hypothetical protein